MSELDDTERVDERNSLEMLTGLLVSAAFFGLVATWVFYG